MDRDVFYDLYGVSSWLYVERSLEEALTKIAGAGFRQVELWGDRAHLDPRANPDIETLRVLLRRLDLHVHSVHLPIGGMHENSTGLSDVQAWLDLNGTALEHCAKLGGRIAVLHVCPPTVESLPEDDEGSAVAFVQALKPKADQLGIKLALENLPRWGKREFADTLADLARMFPDESIGFCLDTGHSNVNGVNAASEVHDAGKRLLSVHANNNDGQADIHESPVNGVLDWSEVEAAFAAIGYEGCRVLEVLGINKDPDEILKQLRELWQQI